VRTFLGSFTKCRREGSGSESPSNGTVAFKGRLGLAHRAPERNERKATRRGRLGLGANHGLHIVACALHHHPTNWSPSLANMIVDLIF
jgi:hypothetical protein